MNYKKWKTAPAGCGQARKGRRGIPGIALGLGAILVAGSLGGCGTARAQDDGTTQEQEAAADLFTDRDVSGDYDPAACIAIALSGTEAVCDDPSVVISDGVVTVTQEGVYLLTGNFEGMIRVEASSQDKVQLVLDGVDIHNGTNAAVYAGEADKLFLTLAEGSENSLSSDSYQPIDDHNVDGVIFSRCDLTINGQGSLDIQTQEGNGVVSKDDLVIGGGTVTVTAGGHGLEGKDSVRVRTGELTVTSGKDGIHADNDSEEDKGFVYVAGGQIRITAGDDGVNATGDLTVAGGSLELTAADDGLHSDRTTTVSDGQVEIADACEGIEGNHVVISGGQIRMNVSDDGLNGADGSGEGFMAAGAFGASDSSVTISGGSVYITAGGDGIDSNGDLTVTGGEIYVSGPENGANGALDYGGTGEIRGGVLVAAGASQMAMNFGTSSTQGSLLTQVDKCPEGSQVELLDAQGNVLVRFTAEHSFDSVVVSCPQLEQGETYTLKAGDGEIQIVMEDLICGTGSGMPFGQGGRGGFRGREDFDGELPEDFQGNPREGFDGELPEDFRGNPREDFDGELPEDFRGNPPEGFDGELPEDFQGNPPEGFDGELPEGIQGNPPEGL